ncbi:MAG: glycosyltransferase, partial [Bacteroidales bacterium]|nr:glycosyltransferase [Bacteroidales bacterium]
MISFIIIGRNEGWKFTKCLQSVFETIEYNKLKDAEVIYVDSKSTDDSLKRAKAYKQVKVFLITGECNAAIARNIGAKESKGGILYFIDGDMEIEKDFLSHAIINNQLRYDCFTGHLDDYLYD